MRSVCRRCAATDEMKGLDVRTQCNLALASNIKSARLEWIGKARHASVIERPSEALAIMRNFLRG